jgi:peroxiredoxin
MRLALAVAITAALLGGALALAARWVPDPAGPSPPEGAAPSPIAPAGPARAAAARSVRDVEAALRELDLFRPPRPRPAVDFSLPTHEGPTFRLAEHRGRVVFINFWATWCAPCREEMPAMERLWRRQRHRPFTMVGVSLDGDPRAVGPFVREHGLTFPIALDLGLATANAYGIRALPTTVLVARDGTVAALALGPRAWDNGAAHSLMEALVR